MHPSLLSEERLNKALRILIAILIGGLPFVYSGITFQGYIIIKAAYFSTIVEVACIIYALIVWRNEKARPHMTLLHASVLVYVITQAVSTLWSVDVGLSFFGISTRREGFFTLLHLYALFLMVEYCMRKESVKQMLVTVSAVASSGIAILLISKSIGFWELNTMGNPTVMGMFLLVQLFVTLYRTASTKHHKKFFKVLAMLHMVGMILSGSRGVLLGFFITIILGVIILSRRKISLRARVVGGVLFILPILLYGILLGMRSTQFVQSNSTLQKITNVTFERSTLQTRLLFWKSGLAGFVQRPLLGYGRENFSSIYEAHYDPRIYKATFDSQWTDRSHNIFIDELINGGILGLLAFLGIAAAILLTLRKTYHAEKSFLPISLSFGIVSYGIAGFFELNSIEILVSVVIVLSLADNLRKKPIFIQELIPLFHKKSFRIMAIVTSVLFFFFSFFFFTVPSLKKSYATGKAHLALTQGNFEEFNTVYSTIVPSGFPFRHLVGEASALMSYDFALLVRAGKLSADVERKFLTPLSVLSKQAADSLPNDPKYLFFQAYLEYFSSLDGTLKTQVSLDTYKKLITQWPRRQLFLIAYAQALFANQQPSEARAAVEQAIALEKSALIPRWQLGVYYLADHQDDTGLKILDELVKDGLRLNALAGIGAAPQGIRLYADLALVHQRWAYARDLYEALSHTGSLSEEDYIRWAIAYKSLGETDKAKEKAFRAVELNPIHRSTAENLIKDLGINTSAALATNFVELPSPSVTTSHL